ncbi:hypothetical protein [Sinorhizobium chiapasense]|uniref:Transposase n=1 Tax=Sinorhizobium chiapasense TaxID=501572 RepID=A0ABZ2BG96_9HYPH
MSTERDHTQIRCVKGTTAALDLATVVAVQITERWQATLLPDALEDYVTQDNPVRVNAADPRIATGTLRQTAQ